MPQHGVNDTELFGGLFLQCDIKHMKSCPRMISQDPIALFFASVGVFSLVFWTDSSYCNCGTVHFAYHKICLNLHLDTIFFFGLDCCVV